MTEILELVELSDGSIALRELESDTPLVVLSFSNEAKNFMRGMHLEVAKSMLTAGLETVSKVAAGEVFVEPLSKSLH